jgi:RND family efflux transporter MFP subunit
MTFPILTTSRARRLSPLAGVALLSALLTANACSRAEGAPPAANAATPVRVAAITDAGGAEVSVTGVLGAKDEIPLGFKIGGVVARVLVDEGARVRAGQLLASLDLREIDASVARATVGAEKARRDAARVERLYHDSVATLVQLQDAQSARDAAEAELQGARVNREYAVIVAPSDGVVLRRSVNPGAQVAAGAQVALFSSAARGTVMRVGVADRDALRIREGDAATITFDAAPGRTFSGRVRQVGAAADPRTGTYAVETSVEGASGLPTGLVGHVQIVTRAVRRDQSNEGVTMIPSAALVEGDGPRGTVFVLDGSGGRALLRHVTLVGVDGDQVRVRGLAGTNRVITAGAAWLRDSARVEVKP